MDIGEGTPAYAELHSAFADMIDRGYFFGNTHRLAQWQKSYREADPDNLGTGGDGAGNGYRRSKNSTQLEVVLGQPDRVDAHLLCSINQLESIVEGLILGLVFPAGEL